MTPESVVPPFVIVPINETRQSHRTLVATCRYLPVGQLDLQGLVEALNFAVMPRAKRFDPLVFCLELPNDRGDRAGLGATPVVVGQDTFDPADSVTVKED